MKVYVGATLWQNGERKVNLFGTEKYYTLTQPHPVFQEEFYSITRAVAVANYPCFGNEVYFHVYEISYLGMDGLSRSLVVDAETAKELLVTYAAEFLDGTACNYMESFFKKQGEQNYMESCVEKEVCVEVF